LDGVYSRNLSCRKVGGIAQKRVVVLSLKVVAMILRKNVENVLLVKSLSLFQIMPEYFSNVKRLRCPKENGKIT
jgi:lipoate-protein ligase A